MSVARRPSEERTFEAPGLTAPLSKPSASTSQKAGEKRREIR